MKRKTIQLWLTGILFLAVLGFAGCGRDTSEGIPTTVPTATVLPTTEPTKQPAPTEMPKDTPSLVPTNAPVEVKASFAMVSPVPQSDIVDIVGTMTPDTYPVVDGSTATLPLSEAVFMAATGESAEVAASEIVHTKTTNSYNRLYNKEVDLLIVYEPAEMPWYFWQIRQIHCNHLRWTN